MILAGRSCAVARPWWRYPLLRGLVTLAAVAALSAVLPSGQAAGAEMPAVSGLSKLPKQIVFVEAVYPPDAVVAGTEADVILNLAIDATGHISRATVLASAGAGREAFDEAAVAAARGYVFEPAESQGKPVAVELSYKVKFRLKAKPVEVPAAVAPDGSPAANAASAASAGAPAAASSTASQAAQAAPPPRPSQESLSGVLKERGTRSPLIGAIVTISKESNNAVAAPEAYEATTDSEGRFVFFDLAPGAWQVSAEPPAYFPFRTNEEVRAGEKTVVTYYVERGKASPYDETVTAARPKKDVTHVVLTTEVMAKIPGTAGDPLAVVQNLAGVNRAPAGSGVVIVRGSAPEDTRIFVDGLDIPLIYHFGGLRSVLPMGVLQNIEFVPGNFSTEYGRATGGIIDVHLKTLKPKRVGGSVDVSILDTAVYLEAPLGDRGGIAVAARRSYLDAIMKAAVPSDAPVNLVTAPVYYDYQLLGNYKVSSSHEVRAMGFGSDDRLELLFKNPAEISQHATGNTLRSHSSFWRGFVSDHFTPRDGISNTLRVSFGHDKFVQSLGDLDVRFFRDVAQVRDTLRLRLAPWVTLVAGLDIVAEDWNGHVRLPGPPKEGEPIGNFDLSATKETFINSGWMWSPAAFSELEIRPTKSVLVAAGLRVDRFPGIDKLAVAPRLTSRWDVMPGFSVKGALGLYHQPPTVDESDKGFGNPKLGFEKAVHSALGVEWKPRPDFTLDVTGFHKHLTRLVSPTDATRQEGGTTVPLVYDNGARGRIVGVELLAKKELSAKLFGWVAYTFSRSERLDSGATAWRLFDYDQTHILTALGSYQLPRRWRVATRFRYVSGNPKTPVVGRVFNNVNDEYDPVFGRVNSAREPAFYQLDVRLDKEWVFDRWLLNVYVDLQNATNHANPEGVAYNFDFTKSKISQGLPILTFLGVRAEF